MVYFKTNLAESSKEGYDSKKGCSANDDDNDMMTIL
jgi:hypothetical protein